MELKLSYYIRFKINPIHTETSNFTNLAKMPGYDDLKVAIDDLFSVWMEIRDFTYGKFPLAIEERFVSVKKFGWSYLIKDKK
ncbi:MAG: hypothetical protein AB7S72_01375 [Draconibacterium sp.]